MLTKLGIIILILAIFGPLIGKILVWVQDVVAVLFFGFFSLPGTVILIIIAFFVLMKILRWILKA